MKILFLTRLYSPHIGGVEKHVEEISKRLVKKHDITIITEQYQQSLPAINIVKRIPVWNVSEKQKKWRIWHWLWQNRGLLKTADIIHIHDVFYWLLPFLPFIPKQKLFITFHGWETRFPPSTSAIIQRRLAAKFTYGNICVGKYIQKWYGIRATYITYGATRQKPLPLAKKEHLLVLGRISRDNDIDKILPSLKNTKVTFVGDGELRSQAEKIGRVTGFDSNTAQYLSQATLVIASSYLSILDALGAGRPVIATYSNPLKRDYLKNSSLSKYINITNSKADITDAIKKQAKITQAAREWIKAQTWDKLVNQYLNLWKIAPSI